MSIPSRLLIQEPPLQVLPSLAMAVGLNEAIILQQIHYWLLTSEHVHDGRRWIYNTYDQWHKQFPFWSIPTIKRTISSLESKGVVESTDKYNHHAIDRTKWYTINYDNPVIHPPDQNDPLVGSKRSALHITETTSRDNTTRTEKGNRDLTREEFEAFWQHYPRKEGKADAYKAWQKLAPEPHLQARILIAVNDQITNNWAGRAKSFIPLPATWLRGERWEDEIIPPTTGTTTTPQREQIDLHEWRKAVGYTEPDRDEVRL